MAETEHLFAFWTLTNRVASECGLLIKLMDSRKIIIVALIY